MAIGLLVGASGNAAPLRKCIIIQDLSHSPTEHIFDPCLFTGPAMEHLI